MRARGALVGLLSGAVGVCVGFLIAGFTGPVGSPVVAIGEASIDLSPPAVKNFAIKEFGSHDKLVLQIGVVVVLALFAAFIGWLAQRKVERGLTGVGVFCVVGLAAALTRPTSTPADAAADAGRLGGGRDRDGAAHPRLGRRQAKPRRRRPTPAKGRGGAGQSGEEGQPDGQRAAATSVHDA